MSGWFEVICAVAIVIISWWPPFRRYPMPTGVNFVIFASLLLTGVSYEFDLPLLSTVAILGASAAVLVVRRQKSKSE